MKITEEKLEKRVKFWQKKLTHLGVSHFDLVAVEIVEITPGDPDGQAAAFISHCYDTVRMWFRESYLEECSADDLDQTILHEWIHVAMRDLDRSFDPIEKYLPQNAYDDLSDRVLHEKEGFVDRTSRALYYAFTEKT